MNAIQYYLVDVFTDTKYGGNQLAVFVDYENKISDKEMLAIARELNLAEITFIKNNENDERFNVRIFTPEYEVPFAGHPSLGTAYIISKYLMKTPKEEITLALEYADIQIQLSNLKSLENCQFKMKQAQPTFYKTYDHLEIAEALELENEIFDSSKVIEEVTTGLPYIIIPIKNLNGLNSIQLKEDSYEQFLLKNNLHKTNNPSGLSTSLFFVTEETIHAANNYHARMLLFEQGSITEDAATGSANGCFLAYLLKHQSKEILATVEQGFKMGRKSYIYLEGSLQQNEYNIYVSGQVKEVGSGHWIIS
jgi:trans-2,3-dihydro-3-hydroxyanthranilate isomerase